MEDLMAPPNKDKLALDSLVAYYRQGREEWIGRNETYAIYESAEKMLAIWRHFVVDGITPNMDYKTVGNMEKVREGVIKNILAFIDKDLETVCNKIEELNKTKSRRRI